MLQFDEETARLLEIAYQGADVTRRRRMAFDALHLAAGDVVVDIGCGKPQSGIPSFLITSVM